MMAPTPGDGETTTPSGPLTPGEGGGTQSGSGATHEDAERTIVVPRGKSRTDDETTVVVDKGPVVNDPERTLVAPTPVEPQRVTNAARPDAGPREMATRSATDEEQTVYQQPTVHQRGRAPTVPAATPPAPQPHAPGSATSKAPGGQPIPLAPGSAEQPGVGPPPYPYAQHPPYAYPPRGPYAGPPYGPVAYAGPPRSKQTRALLWGGVGLAGVVLAAGCVIVLVNPEGLSTKKLDIQSAQSEIERVLTDDITGYGDKNVADIKCNNGENVTVKQGASFTCQLSIDGASQSVTATFLDNDGNFGVGRPD